MIVCVRFSEFGSIDLIFEEQDEQERRKTYEFVRMKTYKEQVLNYTAQLYCRVLVLMSLTQLFS